MYRRGTCDASARCRDVGTLVRLLRLLVSVSSPLRKRSSGPSSARGESRRTSSSRRRLRRGARHSFVERRRYIVIRPGKSIATSWRQISLPHRDVIDLPPTTLRRNTTSGAALHSIVGPRRTSSSGCRRFVVEDVLGLATALITHVLTLSIRPALATMARRPPPSLGPSPPRPA